MGEVCRPTPNDICSFGLMLNRECHLKTYTIRVGPYSYAELQNENKDECGPKTEVEESATICFHHEKLPLSKYHLLQKTCNPLKNHKKTDRKGLRQIPVNLIICVISDCLEHTATIVHSFISCIIHHLISDVSPHLRKVYYFSYGASS
jgi:hypothetical protein